VTARRIVVLLVACIALVAVGCGSSKKSSGGKSNPAPAPSTTSSSSSSSSSSGGAVTVSMKNIQFNPKTVSVKVGQTVKWVNDEDVPHNVKAESGASFASKTFSKGGTFEFTPKTAGTISYVCTIHAPAMAGTLTVTK
jgi:plastocyanin